MKHAYAGVRFTLVAVFLVGLAGVSLGAVPPSMMQRSPVAQRPNDVSPTPVDLTAADGGVVAGGYPAQNVTMLSNVPLGEFPGGTFGANDVWGYTSPSGREYAIIGLDPGTGFVDVTDPTAPLVLANIPDTASLWSDMAVYDQYAYNVNESGGGIQVIDLTQIDSGIVTHIRSVTGGLSTSHNIYANPDSGFVYTCGSNGVWGLVAFDLADPANPQFAGTWTEQYTHDVFVQSYDDCPYAGRSGPCEIAFSFSGGWGMVIIDVTDKSNMVTISNYFYPEESYCHQGWLTEDKRYILFGDEGDEFAFHIPTTTYVVDVQDLANPTFVTSFDNGLTTVDHNLMTRGHYVFEANYESGLRVYDFGDLNNVQEVGYFDTYPARNAYSYNGAWGVFSGLPSGVVLVSDQSDGLFVLDAMAATGCQTDRHCDDYNDCTVDTCDVDGLCLHANVSAGSACDDGEACTVNGTCDAGGNCVSDDINTFACSDDGPCSPGFCDIGAGHCVCLACVGVARPYQEPGTVAANRFLTFTPDSPGVQTAISVTVASMPASHSSLVGTQMWVTEPYEVSELPGQLSGPGPSFMAASLGCEPVYLDWGSIGEISVASDVIIPGGSYAVQAIGQGCQMSGTPRFSVPLAIENPRWGDVVGSCSVSPCTAPDGIVNVTSDVVSLLDKFQGLPGAPVKARADLEPGIPDMILNITDVTWAIDAFSGGSYPFAVPAGCP